MLFIQKYKNRMIIIFILVIFALAMTSQTVPIDAGKPTLKKGMSGSDVGLVQKKLKDWGYYNGNIDNVFGEKTYNAVIKFQKKNGLKADGVVGRETWAAIGYGYSGSTSQGKESSANDSELYLLAQLVHGEARGEPYNGKIAVAAVILNRVESPDFPNSIAGVIYQPLAFESISNGQAYLNPDSDSMKAAQDALNGVDPSYGALYFWNPVTAVSKWIWSRQITCRIGKHVFGI